MLAALAALSCCARQRLLVAGGAPARSIAALASVPSAAFVSPMRSFNLAIASSFVESSSLASQRPRAMATAGRKKSPEGVPGSGTRSASPRARPRPPRASAVDDDGASPRRRPRRERPLPRPAPGSPRVLVLAGPTASGKSAASLALAERLGDCEIVNADSVQVYKGLDVGSAKLPVAERRGIPHHLIDVVDPLDRHRRADGDGEDAEADDEDDDDLHNFSAGAFFDLARAAIADVVSRGKTPIVVGGTGLYLRWLVHGRPSTRPASAAGRRHAREAVERAVEAAEAKKREGSGGDPSSSALTREERWAAACSTLSDAGDPAAAERIGREVNNEYRLLRALAALFDANRSGDPSSPRATLESLDAPGLAGGVKAKSLDGDEDKKDRKAPPPLDYDFRCFFLHASSRERAYRRIDSRAEEIVAGGLFDEAAMLLSSGARVSSCSAARAIGYRQAIDGILDVVGRGARATGDGLSRPRPTEDDVARVAAATQAASRRLAHSQYTWFRGDPLYRWVAVGGSPPGGDALDVSSAVDDIAECFSLPRHDPSHSSSSSGATSNGSDGRLTKEEEQALRRYVPRLTLLNTDEGMKRALKSFESAVAGLPEEVAEKAREEAAKRRRQRESESARATSVGPRGEGGGEGGGGR